MGVIHNGLAVGSRNCVVDIEGAAGLDLNRPDRCQCQRLCHQFVSAPGTTYGEIECNLCSWLVHLRKEAGIFACNELVSEGGG